MSYEETLVVLLVSLYANYYKFKSYKSHRSSCKLETPSVSTDTGYQVAQHAEEQEEDYEPSGYEYDGYTYGGSQSSDADSYEFFSRLVEDFESGCSSSVADLTDSDESISQLKPLIGIALQAKIKTLLGDDRLSQHSGESETTSEPEISRSLAIEQELDQAVKNARRALQATNIRCGNFQKGRRKPLRPQEQQRLHPKAHNAFSQLREEHDDWQTYWEERVDLITFYSLHEKLL